MGEIEKQRIIGKELMIINIIHCENKKAMKGGYSFLHFDSLCEWSGLDNALVDDIFNICASLDISNSASDAAFIFEEKYSDTNIGYTYARYTIYHIGTIVFAYTKIDIIEDFCDNIADYIFSNFKKEFNDKYPNQEFVDSSSIKLIVDCYLEYMVDSIERILSRGYDWCIIQEALWFDLSHQRFESLREYLNTLFQKCSKEEKRHLT